jgi:hypothetical protein
VIRRVHGSWRTIAGALAAWSAIVTVASCSTGDAADRNRRTSDVYVAVLDAALDHEPTESEPADDPEDEEDGDDAATSSTSSSAASGGSSTSTTRKGSVGDGGGGAAGAGSSGGGAGGGGGDGNRAGGKPDKKDLPLVFVSPLEEGRPFPLEVQATVIERLGARATIRFVDTQQQAVDAKVEDRPVLDGGVLLRLGRVPPSGEDLQVAGERYEQTDDWMTLRFSVRSQEDGWTAALVDRRPRPAES